MKVRYMLGPPANLHPRGGHLAVQWREIRWENLSSRDNQQETIASTPLVHCFAMHGAVWRLHIAI